MEINKYYSEEELSSIRFSCADEAIGEVKNLFFQDQLDEERILLEIYSPNNGGFTKVDRSRLKIDRILSKKQINHRTLFNRKKLVDSSRYQNHYSIGTILEIKSEQKRLGIEFKGYFALMPINRFTKIIDEPLLFVSLGSDIYYLINDKLTSAQNKKKFSFRNFKNWIQKKIFTKTSSK